MTLTIFLNVRYFLARSAHKYFWLELLSSSSSWIWLFCSLSNSKNNNSAFLFLKNNIHQRLTELWHSMLFFCTRNNVASKIFRDISIYLKVILKSIFWRIFMAISFKWINRPLMSSVVTLCSCTNLYANFLQTTQNTCEN